FVYMADEDFETAEAEAQGGRTIDIRAFVPYDEMSRSRRRLAKEADIAGRSDMSKEQLVEALEAA
ncbi:MAG: hypothetical protein ACRDNE_03880, partial [Gaiellaceae bacterium]